MSDAKLNMVGVPRSRVDGRAKVTGQTKFADDVVMSRAVHCKLLRSKVPHANLKKVDVSKAEALPGVLLVLTGQHFPVQFGTPPRLAGRGPALPRPRPLRGGPRRLRL